MKILYVIHSLNIGGAESLVTDYLIYLKRAGYDVSLLQICDMDTYLNKKLLQHDIKINTLCKSSGIDSILFYKLLLRKSMDRMLREINPDIVHIHTNINFLDKLSFPYERCFYTFHTKISRNLNAGKKWDNVQRKIGILNACKKGMTLVALSQNMYDDIQCEIGHVKTVIIPNGIDIEAVQTQKCEKEDVCKEIGVLTDCFIVGHVGRYHPVKNHEKVIDIFYEVHKRKKNSYLVLVGGYDRKRKKEIDERINKYKLSEFVIQMGVREDAKRIMSVFDCFILPSHVEGFPLVFAEAQVFGIRSIVASTVPDEALINDNTFKLDSNLSEVIWADYILGDFEEKRGRDIMELDIRVSVEKCLREYERVMR